MDCPIDKRRILFIDRDGVIVEERQVDSYENIEYIPHVFEALRELRRSTDFLFVMVSNQDGVNTPSFPREQFWGPHNRIMKTLRGEDIAFDEVFIDFSLPEDNCPGRKPGTAMLESFLAEAPVDYGNSFVIGDRESDMLLARNIGCRGIRLHDGKTEKPGLSETIALESPSWLEIASFLTNGKVKAHRTAEVERKTKETDIALAVDLDGTGKGQVKTGIGFFDHMLEQVVRHSSCDINARVDGDLEVDEHHSVEDLALALGKAFREALGDKRGINRYGHDVLTMDEVRALVALDFSGRPDFVWEVSFAREYVGGFPTEMIRHFFKSFSDAAACNLHMCVTEGNTHHQAEALFKAFARSLRMAVKRVPGSDDVVSTKGVLE